MLLLSATIDYAACGGDGEDYQNQFRGIFQGNDTTHLQKALFVLNYLDFCVLPRTTLATFKYF